MKKLLEKFKKLSRHKLNPENPKERKEIIRQAVSRTIAEYGETLKKLGTD